MDLNTPPAVSENLEEANQRIQELWQELQALSKENDHLRAVAAEYEAHLRGHGHHGGPAHAPPANRKMKPLSKPKPGKLGGHGGQSMRSQGRGG